MEQELAKGKMVSELVVSKVESPVVHAEVVNGGPRFSESAFDRFFADLKPQQKVMVRECLEAIIKGDRYMMRINGRAGTGKSFCVGRIIDAVVSMGIVRNIVACAPTHQAVGVLEGYLSTNPQITVGTVHSCIGLRAKKVNFSRIETRRLHKLLSTLPELRSDDDIEEIKRLTRKQLAASQRLKKFEPASKLPEAIVNAELVLVDECSMVNAQLFELIEELPSMPEMEERDPKLGPLQILFVGDLCQLPPVKESISRTGEAPAFTELTEVVRYGGKILEYAHGVLESNGYATAHYRIAEDETFLRLTEAEVMDAVAGLYADGHDIRFLAATNARVAEINEAVRFRIRGEEGLKNYYTGDQMLTTSVIERSAHDKYIVSSGGQQPFIQLGTSTIIQLGPECLETNPVATTVEPISESQASYMMSSGRGNELTVRDGKIYLVAKLRKHAFTYRSALGTTFRRRIFGYLLPGERPIKGNGVVLLLDPEQKDQYAAELKLLGQLAKSAYSSSENMPRGQAGEYAKQVFQAKGLKNWFIRSNGTPISDGQFQEIRQQLWADYFDLANFVDSITLSYASTVHRLQGGSAETVVIDTRTVMAQRRNYGDGIDDTRQKIYTAATRARKQLVFMS